MRKIYCQKCKKYLGEIRDAKLRKDIAFLCKDCETQRMALELRFSKTTNSKKGGLEDLLKDFDLGDIFNKKK